MGNESLIRDDILAYLQRHEEKELLRFITCGSVDDGKSTLIGRLLHDTKLIYEDQLAALKAESKYRGKSGDEIDLSLLVDGLQAEREQGITIDVAYRYFSTDKRKFIIADTPGHEQYTRNMATGASNAELAVILIDAKNGMLTQTRRHSYIVHLLGIKKIVVAVNKMDIVGYDRAVFEAIAREYREFSGRIGIANPVFVPISALKGDNIVTMSDAMTWYGGPTLLSILEETPLDERYNFEDFRFPIQYVNRPDPTFRGYSGTVQSGVIAPGDRVTVLPSGQESTIEKIITYDGELDKAWPPLSVTLTLADNIDVSRGDMLVHAKKAPGITSSIEAMVVWMHESPLVPGKQYYIKRATTTLSGTVSAIRHAVNVNTLEQHAARELPLNGIGLCHFELSMPIAFDPYLANRGSGGFIIIDRVSNTTAGAGMITGALAGDRNIFWHGTAVDKAARRRKNGHPSFILWFTGLSGSGKSTLANALEEKLFSMGYATYLLDGDNIRHGLSNNLGFSADDRRENIRRIAEAAKLFVDAGIIVLTAFISPFREERALARSLVENGEFIEIHVDTPLEVCESRDPKGLYRKARAGEIRDFTGIDSPYEVPENPELVITAGYEDVTRNVHEIITWLHERKLLNR